MANVNIAFNDKYSLLFETFGLPNILGDCARGKVVYPSHRIESPPYWYNFPPAFLPIWCDHSLPAGWGCWKHWFTSRPISYVKFDVESNETTEIARSSEQLLTQFVLESICVFSGITSEVKSFADDAGVQNLAEIVQVIQRSGFDPVSFAALPQFHNEVPLNCVSDVRGYDGDFPVFPLRLDESRIENVCAFEFPIKVREAWPANLVPLWLSADDPPRTFEMYLHAGDFSKAWLTLNSPFWSFFSFSALKAALAKLSYAAQDPTFALLVEAWSEAAADD